MSTSPPSRIVELSTRIAANTAKLNEYLVQNGLPQPGFDLSSPLDSPVPKHETDIEEARMAIVMDTEELRRLALGPREYLMRFKNDDLLPQQAIVRYRLAHSFPVGEETTFARLAASTNGVVSETRMRQIIRLAVTQNIFAEPKPGIIVHTAASRLLAEDDRLHDWVGVNADEFWPGAAMTCRAMDKWPGSEEVNETVSFRGTGCDNTD